MKLLLIISVVIGCLYVAFVNCPYTLVRKDELKQVRSAAVASSPKSNGSWMWQDHSNPLDRPAYSSK